MFSKFLLCPILGFLILTGQGIFAQSGQKVQWSTDSEALPQNSIKAIAPDKYGFLWLTTENGLVRYDGREFRVYNSANHGFKNNRFVSIHGDPASDSLYTYNEYQEDIVLITKRNPRKLLGRERQAGKPPGIDRTKPFVSKGVPSMLFDVPLRPYIIPTTYKNYYLIAAGRVSLFTPDNKLIYTKPFKYDANANFFLVDNSLFYITNDGSYTAVDGAGLSYGKLKGIGITTNTFYWNVVSKQIFVYSDKNLYEVERSGHQLNLKLLLPNEDLSNLDISCIFNDSANDMLFLGSFKNGLGMYRTTGFKALSPGSALPLQQEVFYAMHQFGDSLAITASGLIMSADSIIGDLKLTSDRFDMTIDHRGNIWVSNLAYLYRYTKSSDYRQSEKWFFPHGITTISRGTGKEIWFTTNTLNDEKGTLYRFTAQDKPIFERIAEINSKVNFVIADKGDKIYLGTRQGLQYLNIANNKLYSILDTKPLNIRSLYFTDSNNIWITTYEKGFFLLNYGKLISFPPDKHNYLQSTHCIIEDKNGYFWLSSNKGLFQVRKQNLLNYARDHSTPVYYHYYSKNYGFNSNEFNGGCQPCGVKLKNDNIFLPSMKGAVSFNPSMITPRLPIHDIFIDEISVNGKSIKVKDTIDIDRNFDRITFFLASPYFGHGDNLNYEAKITGPGNSEWQPVDGRNISFTKLPPGKYNLSFRKLRGFDGDYDYKNIFISIAPAFWQTPWFKIFSTLFAIICVILFYRMRLIIAHRRNDLLEKAVAERTSDLLDTISTLRSTRKNLNTQIENNTKVIQFITHDIKSPLKFVAITSKHLYDTYKIEDDDFSENLKSIYSSSNQMYNFVSNLLDYSRAYVDADEKSNSPFILFELITEKIALFEAIATSQRTVLKNVVPSQMILTLNRQLFAIIIHNLLDNATKNTINGTVMISAFKVENKTHIVISDTGNGMHELTLAKYRKMSTDPDHGFKDFHGLGLHIIIELLAILGGRMKIDSKPDIGTTITLVFDQESNN
jgi:signal transduction histidine kinase